MPLFRVVRGCCGREGCPECSCKEEQYGPLTRGPDQHLLTDADSDAPRSTTSRATEQGPDTCARMAGIRDPLPVPNDRWDLTGETGPGPEAPVLDDLVAPVVTVSIRRYQSNDREVGNEMEDRDCRTRPGAGLHPSEAWQSSTEGEPPIYRGTLPKESRLS
jgi:hypothetical protein